ncbi:hypothetical protein Leryth_012437 [Lithospermum erythrorhizon]|nr:hypothetical protein Leryth_012437 [Lithospermum erythrorhizon]
MKGEGIHNLECSFDSPKQLIGSVSFEAGPSSTKDYKASVWSGFLVQSICDTCNQSKNYTKKTSNTNGWTAAVRKVMYSGTMRRIFGLNRASVSGSRTDIWLLGVCYRVAQDDPSADPSQSEGYAAFVEDFSSRICITYRKGFAAIEDTKYTSDAGWGCMLRSSQMLVAQALLVHQLGRSWRKALDKPLEPTYFEILHLFGDSMISAYSIHNLLQAGKAYGLAPGSWVGPYAMCRTWETLSRCMRKESENSGLTSAISIYVVSGDEDGERGGAPVVCIEDIYNHCVVSSNMDWTPLLLLVPLVLGLDKINPRYLPLLGSTFTFPQSLGILGGRPGVSTYIIGVQDEKAFYLDPHETQPVVDIMGDCSEVDTSSFHCSIIRQFPLDSIDPSLAIGFYCRDENDFADFCSRAIELADQSNGAPLFTITETRKSAKSFSQNDISSDNEMINTDSQFNGVQRGQSTRDTQDEDWQFL